MRVLVTGANGYIGRRLLPQLVQEGHEVIALVRDPARLELPPSLAVEIAVGDLMDPESLKDLPKDIDAAYYLVHSLSMDKRKFAEAERRVAENFVSWVEGTDAKQVLYLGGLGHEEKLSAHLASRREVEGILGRSRVPLTVLRAGIIVGAGSASFEIMRDLVEKLPVMTAPRWVGSRCQPIGIVDVLYYLVGVLGNEKALERTFEVGGPDVLTYQQMLQGLAKVRKLKRLIIPVPVLTPRLSSYWLVFVTASNYPLARNLVESLRNEAVCTEKGIDGVVPHDCMSYEEAVSLAFTRISQNAVVSSWKDAWNAGPITGQLADYVRPPEHGCYVEEWRKETDMDHEELLDNIWSVGGKRGWLYMDWAWRLRGRMDQLVGGTGLRRGRRAALDLRAGDALDFWRVLLADREAGRLLLFAEMKVPGEAWLEFQVEGSALAMRAIFRPRGLLGRLYWWGVYPLHAMILNGLCDRLAKKPKK